jgi:hypothetical protein
MWEWLKKVKDKYYREGCVEGRFQSGLIRGIRQAELKDSIPTTLTSEVISEGLRREIGPTGPEPTRSKNRRRRSSPYSKRGGSIWSKEEDRQLLAEVARGLSNGEIAEAHDRTRQSIEQRMYTLKTVRSGELKKYGTSHVQDLMEKNQDVAWLDEGFDDRAVIFDGDSIGSVCVITPYKSDFVRDIKNELPQHDRRWKYQILLVC